MERSKKSSILRVLCATLSLCALMLCGVVINSVHSASAMSDITSVENAYELVSQYDLTKGVGIDKINGYNLTNVGLTSTGSGVEFSNKHFMYAPVIENGKDISDFIKGSFSVSFRIYARQSDGNGKHVILSTGGNVDDFLITWEEHDIVVTAKNQRFYIGEGVTQKVNGILQPVYMLDETASWYRYSIVYDENKLILGIRIDREVNGQYGPLTVVKYFALGGKISFGGNLSSGLSVGALSDYGNNAKDYAQGQDCENLSFSPKMTDLRIYTGAYDLFGIDEADEVVKIWMADEGATYNQIKDRVTGGKSYDPDNLADNPATTTNYNATITNDSSKGTVSGITAKSYASGTDLSITITPKSGYAIGTVQWCNKDVVVTNSSGFTFNVTIQQTSSLVVNYEPIYTVTVNNDSNMGKVTGVASGQTFPKGKSVSIRIEAKLGYIIKSVTWAGSAVTITNQKSFTFGATVNANSTLAVTYVQVYEISVNNDSAKGTVTGVTNGQTVNKNESVSITITPKSGYRIAAVAWAGSVVTVTDPTGFSFTRTVTTNSTLEVVYNRIFNVTLNKTGDGDGFISGIATGTYPEGSLINITISPKSGSQVDSVTWDGVDMGVDPTGGTLALNIDKSATLNVEFGKAKATYQVSISNDANKGTVTGVSNGKYVEGRVLNITVTPASGYKINTVKWGDTVITVTNPLGFTFAGTVNKATTLEITYIAIYDVTVTNDTDKGTVTGIATGSYSDKEIRNVTITPKSGYKINTVTWAGSSVPVTNVAGFTTQVQVLKASELVVTYTKICAVVVSKSTGGSVVGIESKNYDENTKLNITVTPDQGYKIDKVIWGETEKTVTDPLKAFAFDLTIQNSDTLSVTFKKVYYVTISAPYANAGQSGYYNANEEFSVFIENDSGYNIEKVEWNGVAQTVENPAGFEFTVSSLTADAKLTVSSVKVYTLSLNGQGMTKSPNKQYYNNGEIVAITVTPSSGKLLKAVYFNATSDVQFEEVVEITDNTGFTFQKMITSNSYVRFVEASKVGLTIDNDTAKGTLVGVSAGEKLTGDKISGTVTRKTGFSIYSIKLIGSDGTERSQPITNTTKQTFEFTLNELAGENPTYTLSIEYAAKVTVSSANGTVTATLGEKVLDLNNIPLNKDVTYTVTPASGYSIESITFNGAPVSKPSFVAKITKATSLVVSYSESTEKFAVTVNNDTDKGTVTGISSGEYVNGRVFNFTVSPKSGYRVGTVEWNGVLQEPQAGIYTVTVSGASTLNVSYVKTYSVSITNDNNKGSVSGVANGIYDENEVLNVTVSAKTGYAIDKILVNGVEKTSTFSLTIEGDTAIVISYKESAGVSITNDNEKGTVTGITAGPATNGDKFNVTITAKSGYKISSVTWEGSAKSVTSGVPFEVTVTKTSSQLVVNYVAVYTVSVNYDSEKGTVTGISSGNYDENTKVTGIVVNAKTGYRVKVVTWNGNEVSPLNGEYTITVNGAYTFKAEFVKVYNVTLSNDNEKGTVEGITAGAYDVDTEFNVNVIPAAGYKIDTIKVNGVEKSASFALTLTGDTAIVITYKEKAGISISNDSAKGTVEGITDGQEATSGAKYNVTITAKEGYKIGSVSWEGNPIVVTSGVPFEVTVSKTSSQLLVRYINLYKVSITNDNNKGTVSGVSADTYYEEGEIISNITVNAKAGYRIDKILVNGKDKSSPVQITVSSVNTIVVSYVKTYNVTVTSAHGTVSGIETGVYDENKAFNVTVNANAGYRIESITVNGNAKTSPFNFTLEEDTAVVVVYKKIVNVNITNNNEKGTVKFNGEEITSSSVVYDAGTEITVKVIAKGDQEIASITWAGETKSSEFVVVVSDADNIGFVVKYASDSSYALVIDNDNAKGTVSGITEGTYTQGTNVNITVVAKDGYVVNTVEWNGLQLSAENGVYKASVDEATLVKVTYYDAKKVEIENDSAKGTATGAGKYVIGKTATVNVIAKEGYVISSIKWNGASLTITDNKSFSITKVINADVTVTVEYAQLFTVSVTAENGKVEGVRDGVYVAGTQFEITATPAMGYRLDKIKVNGDEKTSFTLEKATEVVASFVKVLNLSVESEFGTVKVNGDAPSDKYDVNTDLTVTATPNEGYVISSIKVNGEDFVNGNTFAITKDSQITVSYKRQYGATVTSANGNVSGIVNDGKYVEGSALEITVTPNEGYRIVNVKVNDKVIVAVNNKYNVYVDGAVKFEVSYAKTYKVIVEDIANGTIDGIIAGVYDAGTEFTVLANANAGYRFDKLIVNNDNKSNPYSFAISSDVIISAEFVKVYGVSVDNDNTKGIVSGISAGVYDAGTIFNATITPNAGYRILNVEIKVGDADPINQTSNHINITLTGNASVIVTYKKTYNLTLDLAVGGSANVSAGVYDEGTELNDITIVANEGYRIDKVSVNGENVESTFDLTLSEDKVITATFTKIYNVAITNDSDAGEILGVKNGYNDEKEYTVSVLPKAGYRIDKVMVNGEEKGTTFNLSLNSTTAIEVTYVQIFNVSVVNDGEKGSVSDITGTFDKGTAKEFTVNANAGYRISYLAINGEEQPLDDYSTTYYVMIYVNSAIDVKVNYVKFKHVTVINDTDIGTVEGIDNADYDDGTVINDIVITPKNNYRVLKVTVNDVEIFATDGKYSVTVNGDIEFKVEYIATKKVTVTNTGDHGTVLGIDKTVYDLDTVLTLNVIAKAGYRISSVKVNGESVEQLPYVITIDGDKQILIDYVGIYNVIIDNDNTKGTLVGDAEGEHVLGSTVSATITAKQGYTIEKVELNGQPVSATNGVYSFDIPATAKADNELTLKVTYVSVYKMNFTEGKYALTTADDKTVIKETEYKDGSVVEFKVTPDVGCVIDSIKVNGIEQLDAPVKETKTIEITFTSNTVLTVNAKRVYNVTIVNDNEKGSVEGIEADVDYEENTVLENIIVKANAGYVIESITFGGREVLLTGNKQVGFSKAINNDLTLEITYKAVYNVIINNDSEKGEIAGIKAGLTEEGEYNVTISANAGYVITLIKINDMAQQIKDSYEITVDKDIEITVEYDSMFNLEFDNSIEYNLIGKVGAEDIRQGTFRNGTKVFFAITLTNDNTIINAVKLNGTSIEAVEGEYSFTIDKDCVLDIIVSKVYKINVISSEGGEITGIETKAYLTTDEIKDVVITPDNGYLVKSITWLGEKVSFTEDESGVVTIAELSLTKSGDFIVDFAKFYTFTLENDETKGTVVFDVTKKYLEGSNITVGFEEEEGYRVSKLIFDEEEIDIAPDQNTWSRNDIKANSKIKIIYTQTYKLDLYYIFDQGTITDLETGIYDYGTELSPQIKPSNGYHVKRVLWNGTEIEVDPELTTFKKTITEDVVVTVEFVKLYNLTVKNGDKEGQGTITGIVGTTFEENTFITAVIIPETNYAVKSVYYNGEAQEIDNKLKATIRFTISSDSTFVVSYVNAYKLTVENDGTKGTITGVENGEVYEKNYKPHVVITAKDGYVISKVVFNDKELEITDETKKTFETESAIRISKVSKLVVEYEVDPNYKAGCNSSVGQSSVIVMTATLIGAVALLIVKRKKEQD